MRWGSPFFNTVVVHPLETFHFHLNLLIVDRMSEVNLARRNFFEWKTSFLATAQDDNKFTDVTLVAKDGQALNAHRIILSCASPLLANLLSLKDHPHPVILLPTVKGSLLAPLLDFLYLGEVLLPSESFGDFIEMVTWLGLENGVDLKESEDSVKVERSQSSVVEVPELFTDAVEESSKSGQGEIVQKQGNLSEPPTEALLPPKSKPSMNTYVQRSQAPSSEREKNLSCDLCDYRIHRNDLLRLHMNSKHDAEKFKCTVTSCSKIYSSKTNLKNHTKSSHTCSHCDHEAESNSDLKLHKRIVHNLVIR